MLLNLVTCVVTLAINAVPVPLSAGPTSTRSTPTARATTQPSSDNVFGDGVHDSILLWPAHSGTPVAPTIIRAEHPGKSIIRPRDPFLCGIYSPDDQPVHDVVISGFVIEGAKIEGVRFFGGQRITVVNCVIQSCSANGMSFHNSADILVDHCVIRNSGYTGSPVTVGHGFYGDGQRLKIRSSLFANNSGHGITFWSPPETSAGSSDCEVSDNVLIGQAQKNTFAISATHQTNPPNGTLPNRIAGNILIGNEAGIAVGFGNFDQVENNVIADSQYSVSLFPVAVHNVYLNNNLTTGLTYDPARKAKTTFGDLITILKPVATQPAIPADTR